VAFSGSLLSRGTDLDDFMEINFGNAQAANAFAPLKIAFIKKPVPQS
jgi:hypothetical protein